MKLLLMTISLSIACSAVSAEDNPPVDFSKLSNQDLIKEFEQAGLALKDSFDVPTNESNNLANPIHGPLFPQYARVRMAIIRRGNAIVPELIQFLQLERTLDRGKDAKDNKVTFVVEVTKILEHIGDPRAADGIVSILEDDQMTAHSKSVAYSALMKLTFVAFHHFQLENGFHSDCIQYPSVKLTDEYKDYKHLAQCYRNWLANEGKDCSRWLDIARTYARKQLAGKDLKLAFQAITFLSNGNAQRDNQPEATLKRLAELIDEFRLVPVELPITDFGAYNRLHDARQWFHFLEQYGPLARPYVKTYLKILMDSEVNRWSSYQFLEKIGGKEAVAYAIEKLPIIEAEVKRLKADPNTPQGFSNDDPRGWWFNSDSNAKRLFDRWVGRTFSDNSERAKWWEQNKDKDPETWLTDSLDLVAKQADEGNMMARYIMTMMLPDLPFHRKVIKGEEILSGSGFARDSVAIIFDENRNLPLAKTDKYSTWLSTHRKSLRYDPRVGGFVLLKPVEKK